MEQTIFKKRTQEEVVFELKTSPSLYHRYLSLNETLKRQFMDFCTGRKTLPILYDTVFKRLMNPELHPERLESCISALLKLNVKIRAVLPTEDVLMDGESILSMDVLVQLEDGAYVLVEVQKVPYFFPAERASCYSSDLLLRQYSRIKSERGSLFSYRDLRKIYTIVFYEKSPEELTAYNETFVHHGKTACDTGLELNFLQEYYLIALDVFRKSEYAKNRNSEDLLAGWLSFFCTENIEDAEALCLIYPWLSDIYAEMAQFGRNPEELMSMFSEALREMDRNTVRLMVDDMQEKIELQKQVLAAHEEAIAEGEKTIAAQKKILAENEKALADNEKALADSKKALADSEKALADSEKALADSEKALADSEKALAEKDIALLEKEKEIQRLKTILAEAQKH